MAKSKGKANKPKVEKELETPAEELQGEVQETPAEESKVRFETTRPVSFRINRKKYEGMQFSFPAEVVEDRKQILRASYGNDIIKE